MTTTPPEYPQNQPGGMPPGPPPAYGGGPGMTPPPMPGYGGGPPMAPGGGWTGPPLADWGKRVQSALVDWFGPSLLAGFVYSFVSASLGSLLYLAAFGWALYQAYQAGQTGQSLGKKQAGTRLLGEATGQPIGGGAAIGRHILHIVDAIICYIGFLFPLWDAKRQTLADKIMKTVVIVG